MSFHRFIGKNIIVLRSDIWPIVIGPFGIVGAIEGVDYRLEDASGKSTRVYENEVLVCECQIAPQKQLLN